ncbi:hypothetical protein [Hansschlegelia plantiphila]|uniref:Uncharacterized protein n=1 Tax=Hansschlegelia plantiphila TaxID=374655 RepID=A0A9W6IZH3_9HYPH|nr:hypothetical protein [Hansschlegelia plantiphila]GLK66679.1 hypothetical protein GCM10008179_03170 [Hansschlegelia plantiphila]
MRMVLAVALALAASGANAQSCFRECLGGKIDSGSDDAATRDAARECRETCDGETRAALDKEGLSARLEGCRAEPLSLADFRKVRSASPSYYVQANVFVWDAKNPFPDRVLTKIEVTAQNLDLNEMGFTGTGLVPPSGVGTFVIPGFFDGYPAVRFAAKVQTIWACSIK